MAKTLSEHAAYELTKAGLVDHEDPEARKVAHDTLALVKRFEKQDHNRTTGKYVLEFFDAICNMMPLTDLTDDPAEWEKFEIETKNTGTGEKTMEERWQSRRGPSFVSNDGGKNWVDQRTGKTGQSADHKKLAEEKAKAAMSAEAVPAAEAPAPNVLANPAGHAKEVALEDMTRPQMEKLAEEIGLGTHLQKLTDDELRKAIEAIGAKAKAERAAAPKTTKKHKK